MAVIDMERLDVEVVEATPDELMASLDAACREELDMTAAEFIAVIKAGDEPDSPAALRLGVLAEALIVRG